MESHSTPTTRTMDSRRWFRGSARGLACLSWLLLLQAAPLHAEELSSASYRHRAGSFSASAAAGHGALTSSASQPEIGSSDTTVGGVLSAAPVGSLGTLASLLPGLWPIVVGAFPSLDLDGDLAQFFLDEDDDGDGLDDAYETNTGYFVSETNTGTSPTRADSDGDGYDDRNEILAGSDPNDRFSVPNGPAPVPGLVLPLRLTLLGALLLVAAATLRLLPSARSRHAARLGALAFVLGASLAAPTPSRAQVTTQVPTQVPFQGLLLDAGGAPVDDSVDLDFALFDALSAGNELWSESHLGVIVVDGVYSVNLGATTPLTQAVLGGGAAFLEITVSGETLVPRQQLLAVPYALVTDSVGSVSAQFVEQVATHFSFDGQEPDNFHPDEGTVDSDGDGVPNFIDPDNDNDGLLDGVELLAGTSLNDVTPTITGVSPDPVRSFAPTTLFVTGTNLTSITSAAFGTEASTPDNVTATSFELDVLSETLATTQTVSVTLANGESTASLPISINAVAPTISSSPAFVPVDQPNVLNITGTGFYPGTIVQVGTQSLVPSALDETSLTVTMAPEPASLLTLVVVHPNGLTASAPLIVSPEPSTRVVFVTGTLYPGWNFAGLGGIAGADAICQSEANAASLPAGDYRAWISDGTTSPSDTYNRFLGPYVLPNGVVVASSWPDLTDGSLSAPINVTAAGVTGVVATPWTGTNSDGTASAQASGAGDCDNWTNASQTARVGSSSSTTSTWSNGSLAPSCASGQRLICFQQ